jgi:hypothetical protein
MLEEELEEQKKQRILLQLKRKMDEIERLQNELKNPASKNTTPAEAEQLIEEIVVPDLKAIKEQKKAFKKELDEDW